MGLMHMSSLNRGHLGVTYHKVLCIPLQRKEGPDNKGDFGGFLAPCSRRPGEGKKATKKTLELRRNPENK